VQILSEFQWRTRGGNNWKVVLNKSASVYIEHMPLPPTLCVQQSASSNQGIKCPSQLFFRQSTVVNISKNKKWLQHSWPLPLQHLFHTLQSQQLWLRPTRPWIPSIHIIDGYPHFFSYYLCNIEPRRTTFGANLRRSLGLKIPSLALTKSI